jgi:hypothetical protein
LQLADHETGAFSAVVYEMQVTHSHSTMGAKDSDPIEVESLMMCKGAFVVRNV